MILKFNEYKKELIPDIFYHNTNKKNLKSIISEGLLINQPLSKTYENSYEYVKEFYNGATPIFLTSNKNMFKFNDDTTLKVDIIDLKYAADIPAFEDYLDSIFGTWKKIKSGWKFDEEVIPEELYEIVNGNGMIYIKQLIEDKNTKDKIIYLTQTIAILENIEPKRIEIINS